MIFVLVWGFFGVFLELIFLFSLFSIETKLLPTVMGDSESSCFLSKIKHIHLEYLFFLFPLIQTKSLVLKHFNFFPQSEYIATESRHGYLLFCFSYNVWCTVLRYHMLHYMLHWYKQPFCFQIVRFLHR